MKSHHLVTRIVALILATVGLSSCGLFHNANDWAYGKGGSPRYVPKEIGHEGAGPAKRGGAN